MKFLVMGQNRDTGARMTLEFEADSKAAAERKATAAGMSVNHVREITREQDEEALQQTLSDGKSGKRRVLAVLFLGVTAAVIFLWLRLRGTLFR